MRKVLTITAKITANVLVILFGILVLANVIMKANAPQISSFLCATTQRIEYSEEDEKKLEENYLAFEYFPSDYKSVAKLKEASTAIVEEVMGEGATLLKNEKGALPLEKNSAVSLYSVSSVNLVHAGSGSSGTNTDGKVNLKAALEKDGVNLKINNDLWTWYINNTRANNGGNNSYGADAATGQVGKLYDINEAPWNVLPDAKKNNAGAAIFVLSRNGGENADVKINNGSGDYTNKNYLELSPNEKDVLRNLKELKGTAIDKIIVIMNTANPVQCDFVDDEQYGVDALLWCGDLGANGANAVADILVGNINPSGKLSDTFWKNHNYNPVYANWGPTTYTGTSAGSGNDNTYVVYQEGIYNGYRYAETRYEDVVLGQGNAGNWKYQDAISYPFGYGLSYTTFSYSDFKVEAPKMGTDYYTVSVKVKNTGAVAGKEAVTFYLQKPYTSYDVENKVEKASVEIVGFGKTDMLAAGASETVTVEVPAKYFASYDAYGKGTYVVDEGDYYFATCNGAHEALNNILALKGKSVSDNDAMTADGDRSLARLVADVDFDAKKYSTATIAKERGIKDDITEIVNRFNDTDINLYEGRGDNSVTYITRSDWEGTVKLGYSLDHATKLNNQVILKGTEQMKADMNPQVQKDERGYPTYGAQNGLTLASLRAYDDKDDDVTNDKPIEYDNELWDKLLDQLTWEDTVTLLEDGYRRTVAIESISKPETIDHNGATGPVEAYGANGNVDDINNSTNQGLAVRTVANELKSDENADRSALKIKPVVYPSNGICASTFNVELMERYGEIWGEDCLWAGYNGLYGPGLNIHRGAYGGRAFEYYSEDGFLTGKIASAMTKGMAAKGAYVYLKHCFLNDQEQNREGICTWANEQSIREIYLRAFQIAIEEGGAQCVMTGFNRLGAKWTGHHGFLNKVLHDEFGMTGFAVTDYYKSYMTLPAGILNGNDLPDGPNDWGNSKGQLDKYKPDANGNGDYGELAWAMRESAHRILYTVAQSNAMNGKTASTKIIPLTPAWIKAIDGVTIAAGVLFGLSAAGLITVLCLNKFKLSDNV